MKSAALVLATILNLNALVYWLHIYFICRIRIDYWESWFQIELCGDI